MTKQEAIKKSKSSFWVDLTPREIVDFQLYEEKLCMPWDIFHGAIEEALGRPVQTLEFAYPDNLKKEFEGKKEKPTFENILNLIPKGKQTIVVLV